MGTLHGEAAEEGKTKRNSLKILNFGNLTEEIKVQIRYESPIEDSWSHRNQMCTGCTFKDFGYNSNQTGKYINIPANYSRPISSWMEWFGLGFYVEIFRQKQRRPSICIHRKDESWKHNNLARSRWPCCFIFCLRMAWKRYFGMGSTLQH